jgi:hypothetical protein
MDDIDVATKFATISSGDTYDNKLQELINNQSNPTLNVARNPHISAYYFMKKLRLLIDKLYEKALNADYYWARIEIQFRGSPHTHYFIKFLEPSIGIKNLGNIIKKTRYHQKIIQKELQALMFK